MKLKEEAEAAGLPTDNIHVKPGDVDWLYGHVKLEKLDEMRNESQAAGDTNTSMDSSQSESSLYNEQKCADNSSISQQVILYP